MKVLDEKMTTTSFIFCYDNIKYTITTHHFIPFNEQIIYSLYGKNKIMNKLLIRPIWNEILVLDCIDSFDHDVIRSFKKSKPLENEDLYIGFNNIKCKMIGIKYFSIGYINGNPRILYYVLKSDEKIERGLSGSPVFDKDNKLIGIFCKMKRNEYYVLPVIYLIKTLEKSDNNNIYWIDNNIKNIRKINNFNIKNNNIYYKIFNNIPTDIFLLLEGDKDSTLTIKEQITNKKKLKTFIDEKVIKFKNFTDKFNFNLNNEIQIDKITNDIIVNIAFLQLLKIKNKGKEAKEIIDNSIKKVNINKLLS